MFTIIPMQLTDYDAVMALIQQTPGVSIRATDSFDNTALSGWTRREDINRYSLMCSSGPNA